jgi:hypothetical protein
MYLRKVVVVAVVLKDTLVAMRKASGVKNQMPKARQWLNSFACDRVIVEGPNVIEEEER